MGFIANYLRYTHQCHRHVTIVSRDEAAQLMVGEWHDGSPVRVADSWTFAAPNGKHMGSFGHMGDVLRIHRCGALCDGIPQCRHESSSHSHKHRGSNICTVGGSGNITGGIDGGFVGRIHLCCHAVSNCVDLRQYWRLDCGLGRNAVAAQCGDSINADCRSAANVHWSGGTPFPSD